MKKMATILMLIMVLAMAAPMSLGQANFQATPLSPDSSFDVSAQKSLEARPSAPVVEGNPNLVSVIVTFEAGVDAKSLAAATGGQVTHVAILATWPGTLAMRRLPATTS